MMSLFYRIFSMICTNAYRGSKLNPTHKAYLNMTKILDIKQTITAANGNTALAKDLFKMLLDDLDNRFQDIQICYQENKIDELAEHIHKLYGATAYCIVPQLREATHQLEKTLANKSTTQLEQLVTKVLDEINLLIVNGPVYLDKEWQQ